MEIFRSNRLSIEKNLYTLPDGTEKERVVVRPGDAVAILPRDGAYCYLIRQYRFAIDRYILEAPAGTMNAGERPEETARRELIEETGFSAGELLPRGCIYTTPGYTTERIYLFEARDLAASREFEKDEDEIIEVVPLRMDAVHAMIREGAICDAKTICLAYQCLR
ncbi:MAG: NUDIX hydrolase [Methanomicrobiales archaeon]|nr:NUDIX hydrolase [Methanomicrobiales archaeon]MDI6876802.1 NUDIX hydrolase [Methanomicrobiales archaeon]